MTWSINLSEQYCNHSMSVICDATAVGYKKSVIDFFVCQDIIKGRHTEWRVDRKKNDD